MRLIKFGPVLFLVAACQTNSKVPEPPPAQVTAPKLLKPTVKRTWIPQKIEDDGKVMEEGHWRYEVIGGSAWAR